MLHCGHVETETTRHKDQEEGLCDRPRQLRQDQRGRGYPADDVPKKAGLGSRTQGIVGRGISPGYRALLSQALSANGVYDAIDDPYTYENSTVLVNKLDLRDQDELDAFEAEISNTRSGEPLPEGELDFSHYCAVHHHLFQDVYTWAGETPHGAHVETGQ